jgi:hypothetical protein
MLCTTLILLDKNNAVQPISPFSFALRLIREQLLYLWRIRIRWVHNELASRNRIYNSSSKIRIRFRIRFRILPIYHSFNKIA